jgi:hypothetical protein
VRLQFESVDVILWFFHGISESGNRLWGNLRNFYPALSPDYLAESFPEGFFLICWKWPILDLLTEPGPPR